MVDLELVKIAVDDNDQVGVDVCMYIKLSQQIVRINCVYVCMYICMFKCMYVCTIRMYKIYLFSGMHMSMYIKVCLFIRMYACMYVRIYSCLLTNI